MPAWNQAAPFSSCCSARLRLSKRREPWAANSLGLELAVENKKKCINNVFQIIFFRCSTYRYKSPSDTSCCWRAAPPAGAAWRSRGRTATGGRSRRTCWPHTSPASHRRWPRSHSHPRWSVWSRSRNRTQIRRSGRSRRCCAPTGDCPRCPAAGRSPWSGALPEEGLQCRVRKDV